MSNEGISARNAPSRRWVLICACCEAALQKDGRFPGPLDLDLWSPLHRQFAVNVRLSEGALDAPLGLLLLGLLLLDPLLGIFLLRPLGALGLNVGVGRCVRQGVGVPRLATGARDVRRRVEEPGRCARTEEVLVAWLAAARVDEGDGRKERDREPIQGDVAYGVRESHAPVVVGAVASRGSERTAVKPTGIDGYAIAIFGRWDRRGGEKEGERTRGGKKKQ